MFRKILFPIKVILFIVIFFIISFFLSKILINDLNTYTRVLMHDFYTQDKADVVFCGASHVSHGINPQVADKKLGLSVVNTGTPNQHLDATYTIIKEAVRLYHPKDIFVELDFGCASKSPFSSAEPSKSTFLVAHYIKNPKAKLELVLSSTSPKYYLNSLIPIGKEKLIDLNPVSVFNLVKSKISGEYYQYKYEKSDSVYVKKGCVLDDEFIENGTFYSEPVGPIPVQDITQEWKDVLVKIIKICKENNINLTFYQNPSTEFYLTEKGNYDEYIDFVRNLIAPYDVPYYDFSLLKNEYPSFSDSDFYDDNHLNKYGVEKFTNVFCDFYEKSPDEKAQMFFPSFSEKTASEKPKIYGLILDEDKDSGIFKISPVHNHCSENLVTYSISAVKSDGTEEKIAENSSESVFHYPKNSTGELEIIASYNGEEQVHIKKYYSAL